MNTLNVASTLALAEWVSPGHPDRLADGIAEAIVDRMVRLDPEAAVGVEVAVHADQVFVTGTIAAGSVTPALDLADLCAQVYRSAGYGDRWAPAPEALRITDAVHRAPLTDGLREVRSHSEDQNVVVGYANALAATNHLPVAHWLAAQLGAALTEWRRGDAQRFGPDFKILPRLLLEERPGACPRVQWDRLTLSLQHAEGVSRHDTYAAVVPVVRSVLERAQALGLDGVSDSFTASHLMLNGAGDFTVGGPLGDNGLSGKKLVIDHYGPSVPIGGGALCGKDPHKVDRAGAIRARQLAKSLVRQGAPEARVTVSWSPGESEPSSITLDCGPRIDLAATPVAPDWFSIPRIVRELELVGVDWLDTMRQGYLQSPAAAWER